MAPFGKQTYRLQKKKESAIAYRYPVSPAGKMRTMCVGQTTKDLGVEILNKPIGLGMAIDHSR